MKFRLYFGIVYDLFKNRGEIFQLQNTSHIKLCFIAPTVCKGKKCGDRCPESSDGDFVCDKQGKCVDINKNPCVDHGCKGKKCGDECPMGDIMGKCNANGDCEFGKIVDCGRNLMK